MRVLSNLVDFEDTASFATDAEEEWGIELGDRSIDEGFERVRGRSVRVELARLENGATAKPTNPDVGVLVLLRHGESQFNHEGRFSGWLNPPLTEQGRAEAKNAGSALAGIRFDKAYTSTLDRTTESMKILLSELGQDDVPVTASEELNERHYGDVQGMLHSEAEKLYGELQVRLWRQNYFVRPPNGESIEDTMNRTVPYFKDHILRDVEEGRNVVVVAHRNTLRAILMELEGMSPEDLEDVEVPTGVPMIYAIAQRTRCTEDPRNLTRAPGA